MFGLGRDKPGKEEAFVFDLEKEVADVERYKEIIALVEQRTQSIKKMLREGTSKDAYNTLGILLHGYISLLKVVGRVETKK